MEYYTDNVDMFVAVVKRIKYNSANNRQGYFLTSPYSSSMTYFCISASVGNISRNSASG
ncbi:hypothetical protein AGMMS50268_32060 [Spirochaetia bacterium]|nr:hypothetical protein AGMMS50268_32060 [Spirochaetia bacterium]